MRSRGIKPGIFKNEALAEIDPPWGRVVFMGLWGLADREGRLLDRPGHIAVEIFPYDLANGRLSISQVEEMLVELATGVDPFILRYEADGRKIIQVVNFQKHQSPHHTEKASELPEYEDLREKKGSKEITVNPPKSHGEPTVDPPNSNSGNPPDRGLLIPDPRPLIPDSLTPEILTPEVLIKERALSSEDLAVLWNEMAPPELAKVNLPFKRPPKDMAKVNDALKRNPDRKFWEEVIIKIHNSPFLRGINERGWKPNIDFVVENAEKIRDGKYDEGRGPEPKGFKALRTFMQKHSVAELND